MKKSMTMNQILINNPMWIRLGKSYPLINNQLNVPRIVFALILVKWEAFPMQTSLGIQNVLIEKIELNVLSMREQINLAVICKFN